MLNKTLHREFENGLPGYLYYFWGEEDFFLQEALSKAIEIVLASYPRDFNYDVFYPSTEPQEILDTASMFPFMAPRRLVVLRDFHQFPTSAIKALKPYLKKPLPTTCMIILSQKAPTEIHDINWKVYCLNIKEGDIPELLRQISARKGIQMTDDAIEYLIEFVGHDIGLLVTEIEKLALSGYKTINGKDIFSFSSMMRKYTSFDLVNALISGQKTKAFRILRSLLAKNTMDAPVILGTLHWHYRQFYHLWKSKGEKPSKMKKITYEALLEYLPFFKKEDFYRIFQDLHKADLEIKTSGKAETVLEILLIKLLQKAAAN
jgi:DNA polymerase-3 subunit delta